MRRFTPSAVAIATALTIPAALAVVAFPSASSADGTHSPMPAPTPKPAAGATPKPTAPAAMPQGPRASKTTMTVDATVTRDAMAGWNLHVKTTGFRWTPGAASRAARPGGGHAHVYIDGVKLGRLYGPWLHLPTLAPGEHRVKVELNGNDHRAWTWKGKAVSETVTMTAPAMTPMPAMKPHGPIASPTALGVDLAVTADPMAGWNVAVKTTGFKLTPWAANTPPVQGTGHMHLAVDGVKIDRFYTRAYHLATALKPGRHTVTVSLNANEHSPWSWNGAEVTASRTITVPKT